MTDIGGALDRKTYTYIEKIDGRCFINWLVSPTEFYGNICETKPKAAAFLRLHLTSIMLESRGMDYVIAMLCNNAEQ